MKRTLSFCLALCMILGLLPVTAFAAETTEPVATHLAAYAPAVTVDGAAAETEYSFSGKLSGGTPFGFLWNKDNLYLAVRSIAAEPLAVTVNAASVSTAETVTATVKELQIPLSSVDFQVDGYGVTVYAAITFGEETWEGQIAFDPNARTVIPNVGTAAAVASGSGENTGYTISGGVYHFWSKYNPDATDAAANGNGGQIFSLVTGASYLTTTDKSLVLDFDFRADALPVITPVWSRNTGIPGGMILALFNTAKRGYDIAIVNTPQGLTFCVNDAPNGTIHTALLGKELKEDFHIRLQIDPDNTLSVYVDDVRIHVFENTLIAAGKWTGAASMIRMDLETTKIPLSADGSGDADFTVSDFRLGYISKPDPLLSIVPESLLGENVSADAVEYDLTLPASVSTDILTNAAIQWTSSHPDVISATGAVKQPKESTAVTLTATLAKDPSFTRTFAFTVAAAKPVHPAAFAPNVTLDGKGAETEYSFSGKLSGGTPFSALWTRDTLYLAVRSSEAKTLTVKVNGVDADVSGAVTDSVTEVAIPLSAVGITADSYRVSAAAAITFGTETWDGKIRLDPNLRSVAPVLTTYAAPENATAKNGNTYTDGVYRQWNKYVATESTAGADAYFGSVIDTMKEAGKIKVVEFDFHSESMPIAKIGAAAYTYSNSYGMAMAVAGSGPEDNGYGNEMLGFNFAIANTADGLVLCILTGDNVPTLQQIPLNKGEKDTFHLRFEYDTGDNLAIFLDDAPLAQVENVFLRTADCIWSGAVWLRMRGNGITLTPDGENDTDYTVSNLRIGTIETPNPLEKLTFDTIKGENISPEQIESNLNLPTTISTDMLSDVKLRWTSSHPDVISETGVIAPEEEAVQVTLTAALVSDPGVTKTFTVTVEAATALHPAAFATATVDGALTEPGWALSGKLSGGTPFGFVWDKENLYLSIRAVNGASLALNINGKSVNTAGAATGTHLELAIPLDAIAVTPNRYGITVKASVTYGDETWQGKIKLDPNVREGIVSTQVSGMGTGGNTDNFGATVVNGVYHLWNKYAEGAPNTNYGSAYVLDYQMTSLEAGKTKVVEFDFTADSLPVVTPRYLPQTAGYAGHGMNLVLVNSEKKGYTVAIVNTAEGLAFCVNGDDNQAGADFRYVLLNKQLKDTFHMRLVYDTENVLSVYVDDALVGTFSDPYLREKSWGGFAGALWVYAFNGTNASKGYCGVQLTEDGANDMDFTLTGLRIGTVNTPDPLDSLTFDTIKGENTDQNAIESNLVLPTLFETDMLAGIELAWTSSNPLVISATGVVRPTLESTPVTLTATLVSDPSRSKSFQVTVDSSITHPAAFAPEEVTVDGKAEELSYAFSGKLSGGTPFSFIWTKEMLYLAVQATAGDLAVTVNDRAVSVGGAVVDAVMELAIPLSDLGIIVDSYGLVTDAAITLGDETWEGRLAFDPQLREQIPNLQASTGIVYGTSDNLGLSVINGAYRMWNRYNAKATQPGSNGSGGRVYATNTTMSYFKDTSRTKVVEFDFTSASMPVVVPAAISNTSATMGMNLSLINGDRNGYNVGIANTENGLVFCINANLAEDYRVIPLNKQVGDSFHMRLEYDTHGDLTVYVDDILLGVFEDTQMNADKWTTAVVCLLSLDLYNGNPAYTSVDLLEDGSNDTDFTVSNLRLGTLENSDPMDCLTFDVIKGTNLTADSITGDLKLPAQLPHSMLSGMDITWRSSDPQLLSDSGVIYPGAVAVPVTLTATLVKDPTVTKTFHLTIAPYCLEAMLHEGEMTLDGKAEEASWLSWKTLSDGSRVAAVWNKGMVYFALETDADTAVITLNGHTLTVDVAAGTVSGVEGALLKILGNLVEVSVPHEAFGVCLTDFGQATGIGITLDDASLPENTQLIFTGKTVDKVYTTIREEMSRQALLGKTDLMHVKENICLPATLETKFFEPFTLTWKTSDPGVITSAGVITRKAADYGKATITLAFAGEDLWSAEVTVDPLTLQEQPSASLVHIGFAGDGVTVDGSVTSEDWVMATRIMDGSRVAGELGALWDEDNLYIALSGSGDWTLTVNGKTYTAAAGCSSGSWHEIAIPLEQLSAKADYGTRISLAVTMDGGSWEGQLELTSTDWWKVGNRVDALPVHPGMVSSSEYRGGGKPTENQGAQEVENGWHIYDLYDPEGNNPVNVRTYVIFMGEGYENFDDRSQGLMIEFDFEAIHMPEYLPGHDSRSSGYSNYGINWSISDKAGDDKYSNVIMGGIFNTADGLYLVSKGALREDVRLNKYLGDKFRVGLLWHADGTFDVYIDGELLVSYVQMDVPMHAIGNCSFVINCLRSADAAQSEADSIDVYMTNIAFGRNYSQGGLNEIGFDTIRGENEAADHIGSDLTLPGTVFNGQLSVPMDLTWTSSNPHVIDPETGKVNVPDAGAAIVKLTVTDRNGQTKSFDLIVPGAANDNSGKLVATKDTNPAIGSGNTWDGVLFTLDKDNNSVILDNGAATAFTSVILRDGDAFSRVNRESLTLWISQDNVTYTQVKDYKLLHLGECWYFYDFALEARYVKVHYTHFDAVDADFTGALSTMIAIGTDDFGAGGGTWQETAVTLTNDSAAKWQDKAVTLPGITGDESTRVLLGGKYLYHYLDGENIVVRIPDLAAGEALALTVLTGNASAMDIANKEAVYEITYGTRETTGTSVHRWITSLKAGSPLPGGGTVAQDMLLSMDHMSIDVSYDGGVTWSVYSNLSQEIRNIAFGYGGWADGGFIYDGVTGRLFYQMMCLKTQHDAGSMENNNSYIVIIYSDDAGKTWSYADTLEPDVIDGKPMNYSISYNDGIMVSSYDGSGPNVDFVFTAGAQYDAGALFCSRVAYSSDGGFTWEYSKNLLINPDAADFEDGLSESSILEREDGVLVLYSRNQVKTATTFAKCYSYDKGITWTSDADTDKTDADVVAETSSVYSGPTEAVMLYWDFSSAGGSEKTPLLVWSGNNAEGGTSYVRSPLNVAVSYDGLETFRNVQDLFLESFLEVFGDQAKWRATNPSPAQFGDNLVITFDANDLDGDGTNNQVQMTVSDFSDWFYRTKGIYDSFENGNVRYEGWNTAKGSAQQAKTDFTDGYAMKLSGVTTVTRSVPYFQNGTVSMDVWFAGNAFELELQSAFASTPGKAAPMGISVAQDGTVTFTGSSESTGLTLQQGWNTLEFELLLTDGKGTLDLNGETKDLPVNAAIGDYICFVTFFTQGDLYVDNVLAESDLDAEVYTGEIQKPEELPGFGINLVLNETIDMNLIPKDGVALEGNVISLTYADGSTAQYTIATVNGSPAVRHSFNADQMSQTITIQIFDAQGTPLTKELTISVRDYVAKLLSVTQNDTEKALMIRLLDYGALAQIYGARAASETVQAADLANSIITSDLRAFMNSYNMGAPETYDPALTSTGGTFSANLTLNESVDLNVYVDPGKMNENEKIVVKLGDQVLTEGQYKQGVTADGKIAIRYSFNADRMNEELTVALADETSGDVRISLNMSVRKLAYVSMLSYSSDTVLCATFAALLDYGALAQQYAGTNTDDLANRYVTADQRRMLTEYPWPET